MFINCWSVSIISISLLLQWGQKAFGRSRWSKIHWPKDVSPFHRGLRWTGVLDEVLCVWEVWSVLHVALANVSEMKQLFLGVLKTQRTQRSKKPGQVVERLGEIPGNLHWWICTGVRSLVFQPASCIKLPCRRNWESWFRKFRPTWRPMRDAPSFLSFIKIWHGSTRSLSPCAANLRWSLQFVAGIARLSKAVRHGR